MEAVVPELGVGKNVTHFVTYLLNVLLSSDSFLHVLPQGRHDATHNQPDLDVVLQACKVSKYSDSHSTTEQSLQ